MNIKGGIIHVSDCCSDSVVAAIMGFFFTGISQTDVMGCDQNFDVITSKHLYFSLTTLW